MKWNGRTRCALVCVGFAALFSVFSFRLVDLQMVKHDFYVAEAAKQNSKRDVIYAQRGLIYDRNDAVLALNDPVENVEADPSHIKDPSLLVPILAAALEMPEEKVAEKLNRGGKYVVLKNAVPEGAAVALREALRAKKLDGIAFKPDFVRRYPNDSMLCHVIGFSDHEHNGIQGVEATMNRYLHGENGFREGERYPSGAVIPLYRGTERPPHDGYNVHLTIDLNLQNIVENELDAAMEKYTPLKATAILMRPDTGEILAMASRPHYDLNKRNKAKDEQMKNRAIIDMMEPGSTFKIVTVGAALNENLVTLDTPIFCENGPWLFGGRYLHDHKYYGVIPVQDVLVKSSNIGAAKIALKLGDEKFFEYIRRFGFGQPTGIELPGEIAGQIHAPRTWSKISISRIPMGHEVGVTPLQMIMAMAAIANGGKLVAPRIVKSVVDENGVVKSELKPIVVRRVLSEEAAGEVALALRGVVSKRGTAEEAVVPGFTISGKTGTAQKVDPNHPGYLKGKEIVSFSGFLPSEHPAFVGLVVLDEAHTKTAEENYGGKVAGPIFAHIAAQAARYLNLEPQEKIEKPDADRVASTNADR